MISFIDVYSPNEVKQMGFEILSSLLEKENGYVFGNYIREKMEQAEKEKIRKMYIRAFELESDNERELVLKGTSKKFSNLRFRFTGGKKECLSGNIEI